jgi:hypothetical protein
MRRFILPLLVCALWLASLAGAGWVRAQCVRDCARAAAQAAAQVEAGDACSCCAKHAASGGPAAKHAKEGRGCSPADCPKCQAVAKALLAVAPVPDAPLFFDTVCGRIEPVAEVAAAPRVSPSRRWRWSLPPPDTLLGLHCQLLI